MKMVAPTGCVGCRGCGLRFNEPSTAVSGRRLTLALSLCLGLPLGVLVVGVWVTDVLVPGQAWLAIPVFVGVSGVIVRAGSRVDALLVRQLK